MKNELSVWTYPCRKIYYLTHPWKLLQDTYRNFRNWWHRGRYGFAYVDVWDWGSWWPKVGANALRYMAEHANGYPGDEQWDTPEKWKEHLLKTAKDLEWCATNFNFDHYDKANEYTKAFYEMTERCTRTRKTDDGDTYTWLEMTEDDKELRNKYFNKIHEITKREELERMSIFSNIAENLGHYFD